MIYGMELAAAVLMVLATSRKFSGATVRLLIDNDAGGGALLEAGPHYGASLWLLEAFWYLAGCANIDVWINRVPSKLNIADALSRFFLSKLKTDLTSGPPSSRDLLEAYPSRHPENPAPAALRTDQLVTPWR